MPGHLIQPAEHVGGQFVSPGVAHSAQAGANSPAGLRNFFVARPCDALLEVDEPGRSENGMGVGVHKSGQHDLARAIDFFHVGWLRREELVPGNLVGCAGRDNLAVSDQHRAIFNQPELAHLRAPSRPGIARFAPQSQQLRRVREKYRTAVSSFGFGV